MKPRFIAGPPGTGKTHDFILGLYKKLLKEDYPPEKIVILSHTNVAANQIKEAVLKLPEMQGRGFTLKSMKKTISTIHSYCKGRLLPKEKFDLDDHNNLIIQEKYFKLDPQTDIERKHKFYRYISDARGHGKTLEEYWKICNKDSYKPYTIELIKTLYQIYTDYKKHKDNNKCDYADMVEDFLHPDVKDPDIDALVIDECQDSNVPQTSAIEKMAKNVKEGHYYLVGDADQTLFEYSGSDADKYHKLAANPYDELKEGKRCSEAINKHCRKAIEPIWDHYGSHRVWTPAKYSERHNKGSVGEIIKGNGYYLPNLEQSGSLDILLDKIKNTTETFLFTYRGTPSDIRCRNFFIKHGLEFSHVDNTSYVSKKELRAHKVWPDFIKGMAVSLTQVKDFWDYMGSKVIVRGKANKEIFEGWIKEDYTVDQLIDKDLLKQETKQYTDFDLVRIPSKVTQEKLIYIKKVLSKGFKFDDKVQVFYGNIHTVKGLTFDNVIVDETITKKDFYFTSLRLKYTAYSRGIFDYWTLAKSPGKYTTTLGVRHECL